MNKFLVLILVCMQVSYVYSQCKCSELSEAECKTSDYCTWGTECKDKVCGDMIGESNCKSFDLPSSDVECYFDGALCKSDPGYCSRTYSTETLATTNCGMFCKVDSADAKKCAVKTCADLGDGSCTGQFQNGKFCVWGTSCEEKADCAAVGQTNCGSFSWGCELDGTNCVAKQDPAPQACTARTSSDCENDSSPNDGKRCANYSTGCVEIIADAKCSDLKDEVYCNDQEKCKWDTTCKDKTCEDYACTQAQTYMKKGVEGLDGVLFCKMDGGCKAGESHDLKDKCAFYTGYHFTWDGTKCELCESVKNALEPEEEDADDDNSSLKMMIMLANVILLAAL